MPKFYARRKRLKELAEREASGEFRWTEELTDRARGRLRHAISSFLDDASGYVSGDPWERTRSAVISEEGLATLAGQRMASNDVTRCFTVGHAGLVFSVIEAARFSPQLEAQRDDREGAVLRKRTQFLDDLVSQILREERISFDFVDGQFVPLESLELHQEVVVPAITLLGGNPEYEAIEKAYRAALEEIHNGTADDAITDGGTALQATLEYLGCDGNALGSLIKSAKKKGIIAAHDEKLLHWVSADRSEKGDAHNTEEVTREDAWLTVHVVGAIIVRLFGEGGQRDSPS